MSDEESEYSEIGSQEVSRRSSLESQQGLAKSPPTQIPSVANQTLNTKSQLYGHSEIEACKYNISPSNMFDSSEMYQQQEASKWGNEGQQVPSEIKYSIYLQNELPLISIGGTSNPPPSSQYPLFSQHYNLDNHFKGLQQDGTWPDQTEDPTSNAFAALRNQQLNQSVISDLSIPNANSLKASSVKSQSHPQSSTVLNHPSPVTISSFQVREDSGSGVSIVFKCNNSEQIKKQISPAFLQYLQKYFLHYFNIIVPSHIDLDDPSMRLGVYLMIYFQYIVRKHKVRLLEFLREESFKEQPKVQLSIYRDKLYSVFSSGLGYMESGIRKIQGKALTSIRQMESLFFKQIQMSRRHSEARIKLEAVCGHKITPSVYQRGEAEIKIQVLMSLRWLVGFEISVQKITNMQSKSDPVLVQKLQKTLAVFQLDRQSQQKEKLLSLQRKIKQMQTI